MKIAFVGKGGSGKTSLSGLFINYLVSQSLPVLAVDSDINQHLGGFLGFSDKERQAQPRLGSEMGRISDYIANKERTDTDSILHTTPPNRNSRFLRPFENNSLYDYFAIDREKLRFMAVGLPDTAQVGERCYHTNMGALSYLLNHIIDRPNEYIVVDLTAGIDTLVAGTFISYDLVFVVVEPTLASLKVFTDYKDYIQKLNMNTSLVPVANKIIDEDDVKFIEDHLQDKVGSALKVSKYIRSKEKGQLVDFDDIEKSTLDSLAILKSIVDEQQKNWKDFYEKLLFFHNKKAQIRLNKDVLLKQIDAEFDIEEAVQKILV